MKDSAAPNKMDSGTGWESVIRKGRFNLTRPNAELVRRIELLRETDGHAFLDLGCGLGRHLAPLAWRPDVSVGLDFSRTAAKRTRALTEARASVVLGTMTELPFADQAFGTVLAWRSIYLQDLSGIRKTISEVGRVLRPGGHFIGSVRSKRNALYHVGRQRGRESEPGTFYLEDDEFPGVTYHFFSKDELSGLFSGFELEELLAEELTHTPFTAHRKQHPNEFLVFFAKKR